MTNIYPSGQGAYGRLSDARHTHGAGASKHTRSKAIASPVEAPKDVQRERGSQSQREQALSVDLKKGRMVKAVSAKAPLFIVIVQLMSCLTTKEKATALYQQNQEAAHTQAARDGGVELLKTTIDFHV